MRRGIVGALVAGLVGAVLPAVSAAAETTTYSVVSLDQPGSHLVADASKGAPVQLSASGTALTVTSNGPVYVSTTLRPPTGQSFAVGTYTVSAQAPTATRAQAEIAYCDWHGTATGTLEILEIARSSTGAVTALAARVLRPCYGSSAFVELRVDSAVPWWGVTGRGSVSGRLRSSTSTTAPVTFTGAGPTVAHLGAASLSGDESFSIVSDGCADAALAPGDTCTVVVSLAAGESGTRTGSLTVPSDSPRGSLEVPLLVEAVPPPPPPSNVRAFPGYDGIGLVFAPPQLPYGQVLTAIRVYRGNDTEPIATLPGGGSQWVDDTALPGETHLYSLSAVERDGGEGPRSQAVAGTVPADEPSAPGPLSMLALSFPTADVAEETFGVVSRVGWIRAGYRDIGELTVVLDPGAAWAAGETFGATVYAAAPPSSGAQCYGGRADVTVHEARVRADGTPEVLAASLAMPACDATAELRINASAPVVALDTVPDHLTSPETPVGSTGSPSTVTVANLGTVAVDLGAATTTGDWSVGLDSCSNTSLAGGASCSVQVAFAPTAFGARTGSLEIPDSTPRGRRRVRLAGTGGGLPAAPAGLVATPFVGRTLLTWSPTEAHPAVQNYLVYRGTSPTALTFLAYANGTRFTAPGGTAGQKLYYAVSAVNGRGEGPRATIEVTAPGRELHYSADTGSGTYHLYTRTMPGGEAVRSLTGTVAEEDPSVSPDGKQLAYTKHVDGNRYHLYVTAFDGSVSARRGGDVNGVPWTYSDPQWSPDGTRLAVACGPVSQAWLDLCMATPQGVTRVKNGAGMLNPSWLPNGRELLAVTETTPRRVDIIAADGSYRYVVPGTTDARRVAVSPDGSRMAWTRYQAPDAPGSPSRVTLRVSGLDGGAGRELVSTEYSTDPAWSPDSETVYYTYGHRKPDGFIWRDIWSIASTGGVPVRLTNTPDVDEDDVTVHDVVTPRALPYVPRRLQDFTGDGRADIAIFRQGTGVWRVRGQAAVAYGRPGDYPVAADYNGDRKADYAVYRPSTQTWHVRGVPGYVKWGAPGDIPVPADYNGDGKAEIAVWRPSNGGWYVRGRPVVYLGKAGNVPVPADYTGDRKAEPAVFARNNGYWAVAGIGVRSGLPAEVPVPDDYAGVGRAQFAGYLPSQLLWRVYGTGTSATFTTPKTTWGLPAYGNVDADRGAEPGVFEPTFGAWMLLGVPTVQWGTTGDLPV